MKYPTPITDRYVNVYEPSEDSFLMLDYLQSLSIDTNLLCLEVCTGTGVISTFVKKYLKLECVAVDLSADACSAVLDTQRKNGCFFDAIRSDLMVSFRTNLTFDLIICNPPYVSSEHVPSHGIMLALEGGPNGRELINRFIKQCSKRLALTGMALMVCEKQNLPSDIIRFANDCGLLCSMVSDRKCGIEHLYIMKFVCKQ